MHRLRRGGRVGERVVRVPEVRGLQTTWVAALPRLARIAVVFAGLFLALRGVLDLLV